MKIKCPSCREKADVEAKVCPHCRGDLSANAEWRASQRSASKGGAVAGFLVIAFFAFMFVDFDCSPDPPSPKPVSQGVLDERDAQWESGRKYAFEMTSKFTNAGVPKDWALEEIAKIHQVDRALSGYEPYWREGFRSGYREGINHR